MPLVFVHGVNVRADTGYYENVRLRDTYFRRFVLGCGPSARVYNPFWGASGIVFRWKLASRPHGTFEHFGADEPFRDLTEQFAPDLTARNDPLLRAARTSLASAIDLAWAAAAYVPMPENDTAAIALGADLAAAYLDANPAPAWVSEASSDDDFLYRLLDELGAGTPLETFGAESTFNALKSGLVKLARTTAASAADALRDRYGATLLVAAGDVLEYIERRGDRGAEGAIVKPVADDLRDAAALSERSGERLVIVAHSMGGNIAYDILTYFAPEVHCDTLITVASQVGLLEEMTKFRASDKSLPNAAQPKVPKPANIGRWLNVFDPLDVLAFAAAPVFADVDDMEFPSSPSPLHAHEHYFYRPDFFRRLSARL